MRVFMSNLGYLRGINGCLVHHVRYAHRHVYCSPRVQEACLKQLVTLIEKEQPDICCFLEITKDIASYSNFNRLETLFEGRYPHFDIENKYGLKSLLRVLPLMRGKGNGYVSKQPIPHDKLFFEHGTKRLMYRLQLRPDVTLFFAHFSLKRAVRARQLLEVRKWLSETKGEIILLGDFNIHAGFSELAPLMNENNLVLLNKEDVPTFKLHKLRLPLDLCICSKGIADKAELKIVPQPFSDHEALVLTLDI